ncbi:2-(5''-triphosphoribosyl)-3'-dephosphocoenzyme- A synthase [Fructilactobacillus florum 8D]|uniref:Probable 2-(5''-triphosphoribosyl)-3'-dephosphocoenzyme-A synthase n=1 Tax=Fructilactobacillus florum 8D TaxID=1221538 RepID=W9EEH4_9LACO|nr:triphosphoribosyl-dephospho-CoA synthase CitG [Fructilactobacillus florum]ETO40523.1 2-(5''-triphosphoribosyl)-3'-dephosphocoenzyme- A synthase [Fructilactobacillus florum 8D]
MTSRLSEQPLTQTSQADVVQVAIKALLYEVTANPKPGLVDPTGNASHPDMNVFNFIDSALAMQPYLQACYRCGAQFQKKDLTQLFQELRPLGKTAEKRMYQVTKQVNTHKGAIFALGILVATVALTVQQLAQPTLSAVITRERLLTKDLVRKDFAVLQQRPPQTAGERQYLQYGTTGIRGEAETGFATVMNFGLPWLVDSQGSTNERLLLALIAIVTNSNDSNLIKRAGNRQIVATVHGQWQKLLVTYSQTKQFPQQQWQQICHDFALQKLSLGGSADLLIVTIFLAKLIQKF